MGTPVIGRITRSPLSSSQWRLEAACQGMDTELFFMPPNIRGLDKIRRIHAAKRVCADCPVREICRAEAHHMHEMHGIWGGEDEETRGFLLSREHPPYETQEETTHET